MMFYETSFDDFAASDPREVFPVVRERASDLITPVGAAMRLFTPGEPSFLLESAEGGERIGRYSLLGIRPTASIGRYGESLDDLRTFLAAHRVAKVPLPGALPAAAVGYMSYDAVRMWEEIGDKNASPHPAFLFHHFRDIVVFDHLKQRLYCVTLTPSGVQRTADEFRRVQSRLDKLVEALRAPAPVRPQVPTGGVEPEIREVPDAQTFREMVSTAQQHIENGEVSQIVLSRSFQADYKGDPLKLYRALRMVNPSPFMFYLDHGDHVVVGASPEDLCRVKGDRVETLPIAGTRLRGASDEEDEEIAAGLLADPKEVAEHMMLIDLARSDLSQVCEPDSIVVEREMEVERFSHVIHLVSRVAGKKSPDKDVIDALCANFPAGTVSGAPRVRAMQLIDELEHTPRGIYAGSVLYFDGRGQMDACIAIRSMVLRDGQVEIRTGAGIIAESTPQGEEQETRNKALGSLTALSLAHRLD